MWPTDLNRFKAACVYPGKLDEQAVERELATFLRALGLSRRIVRLRAGLRPEDDPPLNRNIESVLAECVKSNLRVRSVGDPKIRVFTFRGAFHATFDHDDAVCLTAAAMAEGAVLLALGDGVGCAARALADPGARALTRKWRGSTWELSHLVCVLFDAVEQRKPAFEAWLRPLFEAFVCGCWLLYWAGDTLCWLAKPTVHRDPGTQRLHHDTHAALESDIVNLYFWQGVMVPPFVIARPDSITIAHIDRETNAEVRRVMIERYRHGKEIHGAAAFIRDAGGERLDHDECYGTLWRRTLPNDEPIVMIEVVNRSREPDGSFKRYWLRVPPTMGTAREAVAWTFNMRAGLYAPEIET